MAESNIKVICKCCFWVVPYVKLQGFILYNVLRANEGDCDLKVNPHIFFWGKNPIKSWIYWISVKWVKRGKS